MINGNSHQKNIRGEPKETFPLLADYSDHYFHAAKRLKCTKFYFKSNLKQLAIQ